MNIESNPLPAVPTQEVPKRTKHIAMCPYKFDSESQKSKQSPSGSNPGHGFSDSTASVERVLADRAGPSQAPVRVVIGLERLLIERGCTVTIRWTPAHRGVEGNEIADSYTKLAAEGYTGPACREHLREESLAHHKKNNGGQVPAHPGVDPKTCQGRRCYRPPPPEGIGFVRVSREKGREWPAGTSNPSPATRQPARTWLREPERYGPINAGGVVALVSGERQSRHHLFVKC